MTTLYNCSKCETAISMEKRVHKCTGVRGAPVTVYNPSYPKSNKQSTVAGYMKRFGSKAAK